MACVGEGGGRELVGMWRDGGKLVAHRTLSCASGCEERTHKPIPRMKEGRAASTAQVYQ